MRVALDVETDGLDPSRVWCIVSCNLDSDEVKTYEERDFERFKLDASNYTLVVGHNIIAFDLPALRRLIGYVPSDKTGIRDTLILSRLLKYEVANGHSLEAWGKRLGFHKTDHNEWDVYTPAMLEYCINDTKLSKKLYLYLDQRFSKLNGAFDKAIEVEHSVQQILQIDVKEGGYPYDKSKADYLRSCIQKRVDELDQLIVGAFPPRVCNLGEYKPYLTKHGTIARTNLRWWQGGDFTAFTDGAPFTRIGFEHFNPGSVKQVVQRLTDNGWWKPTERTEGYLEAKRERNKAKLDKLDKYGWKLSESNLSTLTDKAPKGARLLVERLALNSRLTMLDTWERAYNPKTKSLHGTVNGIGTWTHRCSHNNPNLANIATAKSIKYTNPALKKIIIGLGGATRSLFHSGGHWQVGCDADGIQLRLFAHYANDHALIEANVNGRKELGTDIHSLNQRALGDVCKTRDDAKTWIYAYLLGAGLAKLSSILKCSASDGRAALQNLLSTYKSIDRLRKKKIAADAARGYFVGVDGRLICCDSEHLMLAGYLQEGESTTMKYSIVEAKKRIERAGIRARMLTFVHDEVQYQVKGTREEAEMVGKIQADCIKWAGEHLNLSCPMKGNYSIGKTWFDTH